MIDRERPGDGHCHLLTQADVRRFISIIPDWSEHSRGLNAIVLAAGRADAFGYYYPGVIYIRAWSLNISISVRDWYYNRRIEILECLGVSCWSEGNGDWTLDFDENSARAYLTSGAGLRSGDRSVKS